MKIKKIFLLINIVLLFNLMTIDTDASTINTPFDDTTWESLTVEQKQSAISQLIVFTGNKLQLSDIPAFFYEVQSADIGGRYSPTRNAIILNSANAYATGSSTAKAVVHEMRHAYQYAHMNDGTPQAQAWKYNSNNYIQLADNYNAYFEQPMEADAIAYSEANTDLFVTELYKNMQSIGK